jgi:hypothetical protein
MLEDKGSIGKRLIDLEERVNDLKSQNEWLVGKIYGIFQNMAWPLLTGNTPAPSVANADDGRAAMLDLFATDQGEHRRRESSVAMLDENRDGEDQDGNTNTSQFNQDGPSLIERVAMFNTPNVPNAMLVTCTVHFSEKDDEDVDPIH